MNLTEIEKEVPKLIRAIRGKRSQEKLSTLMGFKSNQLHRWESGAAPISWKHFLKLCRASRIPIGDIFESRFSIRLELDDWKEVIRFFSGNLSAQEITKNLGVTRHQFSRWKSGKVCPNAIYIFSLIDYSSTGVFSFFDKIISHIPAQELPTSTKTTRDEIELLYELPYLSLISMALHLPEYLKLPHHEDDFIAKKASLSLMEVRTGLTRMKDAGIVNWDGKHYNPLAHKLSLAKNPQGLHGILKYFRMRAAQSFEKEPFPKKVSRTDYKVFTIATQDLEKLKRLYLSFYRDLDTLIGSSPENVEQTIFLLMTDLLSVEEL